MAEQEKTEQAELRNNPINHGDADSAPNVLAIAEKAVKRVYDRAKAVEKENVLTEKGYISDVLSLQVRLAALMDIIKDGDVAIMAAEDEEEFRNLLGAIAFKTVDVDTYLEKDIVSRAKSPFRWNVTTHVKMFEFCSSLASFEADLRRQFREAKEQQQNNGDQESEVKAIKTELHKKEAQIRQLTTEVQSFKEQIKQHQEHIKQYQEHNKQYEQQIKQLQEQIKQSQKQIKQSEAQIKRYQEQNKRLEEKVLEESAKSVDRDKRVKVLEDQMAQMISNFNQCTPSTSQDN